MPFARVPSSEICQSVLPSIRRPETVREENGDDTIAV